MQTVIVPFDQLLFPFLMGVLWLFLAWSLNRSLRRQRPISDFGKKLLSHGFLLVTGTAYFMAWDTQLAALLRFPGREVWRPLTVAWAVFLLYDASRRLHKNRQAAAAIETSDAASGTSAPAVGPPWSSESRRAFVTTILRFLLFFAAVGAIGRKSLAGLAVVAALFAAIFLINKLWKTPSYRSKSSIRGTERTHEP